jgi:cell division septum initiation protein DivIVA|tara:strand:- start:49 stop:234 length:186 start_codon:yes stop_codon:yes gene_type:complete
VVGNVEITNLVYLELLEKRIVKYGERVDELEKENKNLKQEIEAINHNHELTVKWIKGELDN